MIEKLIKHKDFKIIIVLGGALVLGLTIYDKIVSIKKNKLEIKKLENE